MVPARFGGVLAALSILLFSTPDAGAVPQDDLRQELARLAQRVDRLEAENEALKARNDRLELAVAELQLPTRQAPPTLAAATPAAPLPEPKPAPKSWYESVKVSGYLFGDAYAVLENHDPDVQDQYGFWVRRAYLTVDSKLDEEWSARLRFEVNSPGDFETNSKLEPFVKDAYLAWKRDGRELYLGLSPSPTFDYIEGFWGLRHIEKTPLDLYRMASSRDLGIAYKGRAREGAVFYHAMLGNGAGDGAETNKGKKIMGSLGLAPTDSFVTQFYADYEDRPGETDRSTLQASAVRVAATRSRERSRRGHRDTVGIRRLAADAAGPVVRPLRPQLRWHTGRGAHSLSRPGRRHALRSRDPRLGAAAQAAHQSHAESGVRALPQNGRPGRAG